MSSKYTRAHKQASLEEIALLFDGFKDPESWYMDVGVFLDDLKDVLPEHHFLEGAREELNLTEFVRMVYAYRERVKKKGWA